MQHPATSEAAVVRSATILVTDLVDSTVTFLGLDPMAAEDLRRRHDGVITDVVLGHGGHVLKSLGDGILARFVASTPALAAAVAVQEAISLLSDETGIDLRLRVGVSAGDVVWETNDSFGRPVIEAARLCGAAAPGQILASDVAVATAGETPEPAVEVGPLQLKGIDRPVTAWSLTWKPPGPFHPPLPEAITAALPDALVGRDADRAAALAVVEAAAHGTGRTVLVAGEPGIGKSALAAWLATTAHTNGAVVLFGRCEEGVLGVFAPFIETLDFAVSALPTSEVRSAAGRLAGDLARLVPSMRQRLSGLPEPTRSTPELERAAQFDAVAAFLANLARRRPVVVVLDDLHWADLSSVQLVRHLVTTRLHGVTVLATYRSTETTATERLAPLVADAARADGMHLRLGGLTSAAVGELLHLDDATSARRLVELTGGNPFLVKVAAPLAVGDAPLPDSVRQVLTGRVRQTSAGVRNLLDVGAVVGQEFPLALCAGALGGAVDDDVIAAADEAAAAGLLVVSPGGHTWAFAHSLLRASVYESIGEATRRNLHLRVADILSHDTSAADADVARHLEEAAPLHPEAAVRAAERWAAASHGALDRLAYESAVEAARRGIAVAPADAPPELLVTLDLRLATATYSVGDYVTCEEAATRAADGAATHGLHDLLADALAVVALVEEFARPHPGLRRRFDEALARRDVLDDHREARLVTAAAHYFAWREGDVAVARPLADEAVRLAHATGDGAVLRDALWAATVAREGDPDVPSRRDIADELVTLGEGLADPRSAARGSFARAMASLALGDRRGFDADVDAFEHAARRCGRYERSNASVCRALQAILDVRYDDAEELAAGLLTGEQTIQTLATYISLIAQARREQGRLDEVVAMLNMSVATNDAYAPAVALRAALRWEEGDADTAAEALDRLLADDLAGVGADASRPAVLAWLSECAAGVGSVETARALEAALLPYAGTVVTVGNVVCLGAADRYLAMLRRRVGDVAGATAAVEAALALDRELAAPALLARTQLEAARVLAAGGQHERARQLVAQVEATAADHGLVAVAHAAEGLTASLGDA